MMVNKRYVVFLVVLLAVVAGRVVAEDIPEAVQLQLQRILPKQQTPDAVEPTPLAGLYEVRIGASILYISEDGRYLIDGSLLDLEQRINLTEQSQKQGRLELLNTLDESEMVVYRPQQLKRTLTIFTDIDCPYCVRLHKERSKLLDAGIQLRYLLYPRAGIGSASYHKAVNVWCSEDRAAALTEAKAGVDVEAEACETPILSHIQLAAAFGLKGTPHIVVDDGEVIAGYMPAEKLIEKLLPGS